MAVSQWENDRAIPRSTSLKKITRYFNIPMSSIMDDEHYAHFALNRKLLTDDERELMMIYQNLDDHDRSVILEIARILDDLS